LTSTTRECVGAGLPYASDVPAAEIAHGMGNQLSSEDHICVISGLDSDRGSVVNRYKQPEAIYALARQQGDHGTSVVFCGWQVARAYR
jgi:hypothetical protein